MNLSSWDECLSSSSAYSKTPNPAKVRSLVSTAQARIVFLKTNKLTEQNARFLLEGYYTSALEVMHAFLLMNGYTSENHICVGYYIRDILNDAKLFRIFDNSRKLRNAVVYYGKEVDFEAATEAIRELELFVSNIKKRMNVVKN